MPDVETQVSPTTNPDDSGPEQYTPANWSSQPSLYSLIINNSTSTTPVTIGADGTPVMQVNVAGSATTMFVFDAIRLADIDHSLIPTQKPLQTGYNTSDHAVLQPARIVLEVKMSDVIAAYSSGVASDGKPNPPMWSGNPSKSVSAFQEMETLMINRALITVNTRYQTYGQCLLVNVRAKDDQANYFGASMVLTFQQLQISTVTTQYNSARSQTTGDTGLGTVQTQPPTGATESQFAVPSSTSLVNGAGTNVVTPPGAGSFTSILSFLFPGSLL